MTEDFPLSLVRFLLAPQPAPPSLWTNRLPARLPHKVLYAHRRDVNARGTANGRHCGANGDPGPFPPATRDAARGTGAIGPAEAVGEKQFRHRPAPVQRLAVLAGAFPPGRGGPGLFLPTLQCRLLPQRR